EPHLDARVRSVGVLTAGATRPGGATLELVAADHAGGVHAQDTPLRGGFPRVARAGFRHGGLGYRPVTFGWATPGGSEPMSSAGFSIRLRHRAGAAALAIASATALLVATAPGASAQSSPKPGGSVVYGLESETGGGWCP